MAEPIPTLLLDPGKDGANGTLAYPPDAHRGGALISCLMVSRGTLSPARHAIDCFRRQTYADRELVIVCDRADSPLEHHLATLADPAIRLVTTSPATLGELRNVSVAHARGELLCQWDDDDLSHPERLQLMAAGLAASGAAAAFLSRELLWWPARRVLAVSQVRIWEGTMLVHRGQLPIYPALGREEDTFVVNALRRHERLLLIDQPFSYCYIVHGRNTCAFSHFDRIFRYATRTVAPERYDEDIARVGRFLPVDDYAADLAIAL